jgi:4-hydroxythreonine-4-phosphate dehydrogenase
MIAITAGDPCGIGPEIILKALAEPPGGSHPRLLIIGDLPVFERTAARLHHRLPRWRLLRSADEMPAAGEPLAFLDCGHRVRWAPGRPDQAAGRAALAYLAVAVRLWRRGRIRALVTAPVTKRAIARVQPSFVGQTECLARAMGVRDVVMMFVSDRLRVALLTRHLPLARVPRAITPGLLLTAARLTARTLAERFGIRRPRLALCGLNPHAGEGAGSSEERRVMRPALRALARQGLRCDGPFAADGFFASGAARYDAVLCAYHDQGLIPFKLQARDRGCQLSAGLPLVRTSPDHGSALDIAGRGIANPGSMRYALKLATRLVRDARIGSR